MTLKDRLIAADGAIAVVGLGYVGLPVADALSVRFKTIGFDTNPKKVELLGRQKRKFDVTGDPANLKEAICFIVAVPTPVDENNVPVLDHVAEASETIARCLKPGDFVVYESTVYPGCTEELCIPILESYSGLIAGKDFKVGYSPERISPGDAGKDLGSIVKVVSGIDEEATDEIAALYASIVSEICKAPSIKVAEAAKLVENVQRDVNISLINELAIIFDKIGIDTHDVLDVASTKWNFQRFHPGLVGGHCISVDPHYLVYKSMQYGHAPRVILSGRDINDEMPGFIVKKLVQHLLKQGRKLTDCRVLVLGVTFKANIPDIRNTRVINLINEIREYSIDVDVADPLADPCEVKETFEIDLTEIPDGKYDVIIKAVPHKEYEQLQPEFFRRMMHEDSLFMDLPGSRKDLSEEFKYWRL